MVNFTASSVPFWTCEWEHYSTLIAFDERVTFWLQLIESLPCACAYVAWFARRLMYNHYKANAVAQGSDRAVEAKKVTLWRQSEYSYGSAHTIRYRQLLYSKLLCLSKWLDYFNCCTSLKWWFFKWNKNLNYEKSVHHL